MKVYNIYEWKNNKATLYRHEVHACSEEQALVYFTNYVGSDRNIQRIEYVKKSYMKPILFKRRNN